MPSVKAEQQLELAPEVQDRVRAILGTYNELKEQVDLLTEQLDAEKAKLWTIAKELGVKKITVDGMPAYEVNGTFKQLDKEEFVRMGGDLKILEMCTHDRPKKAYFQVGKEKVQKGEGS